ncbi:MAG: FtsW/RodA/SpoVE family cell cycle protein [Cellulosilyticum sp.]|nr:FtsW/RodA/SpoVE family cell cycle protein [Cellulosilyticum sp.]
MGYFNIMILLSRYIFAGFGILFVIVAFSFMKPFISYNLGGRKEKNRLLSICLYFFHLAGLSIIMGKQTDEAVRLAIGVNGLIMLLVFVISFMILKMMKRHQELVLWQMMFFIMDIGFLMLERLNHDIASKQMIAYILGTVVALIFPSIFSVLIKPQNKYFYLVLLAITMVLPFAFGDTIYGATNWVSIGPISFQPSEIGKVALVLFLASTLSDGERQKKGYKGLIFPAIVTVIALGCLVIQKDLGAVLLYYVTALLMVLVATQSVVLPAVGFVLASCGSVIAYFLFGHVRVRVEAWLNPWADINGTGYQVVQGLFAIGTWGWLGSGLTRGTPTKIPMNISDYIFAAVCEEFGNIIGIVVLLCYLGIILLCLQVAFRYSHAFYRLVIVGIASLFGLQVFIIIGGVLKLIPLTGITTPFMSAGGTSIIVSMGMIGLITYFSYKARIGEEKGGKTRETR